MQGSLEQLESRRLLAFSVNVNFQPDGVAVPAGFRVDTGAPYGLRANGMTYGWSADNRANTRDRNSAASPDQRYDTLNHMQKSGTLTWEIKVPNGKFSVRLLSGDSDFFADAPKIDVESTRIIDGSTSTSRRWIEGAKTVTVTDGKLTLKTVTGSRNAKVNFVEIKQVVEDPSPVNPLSAAVDHAFAYAQTAITRTMTDLGNNGSLFVDRTRSDGTWRTTNASAWTAGFLGGAMWQLFQKTGNTSWKTNATKWTTSLAGQTGNTGDLAFKFLTTYLPLYQQTASTAHRQVLLDAAASKNAQWNNTVGAYRTDWFTTRSGNPRANFAVLMDMTTDMELLMWAGRQTGNQQYIDRAVAHTLKVIANQVRPDGSISQFGMYDSANGDFIMQETYQGYSNSSTWSRGQAWAILSFAAMARDTGRADITAAAKKVADYFIANLPSDFVPYWDFNHPSIPNTFRDSSAAAVAASGLLELSRLLTNATEKAKYKTAAENILKSLLSPAYFAEGSIHRGLLIHGAGNVPNDQFARDNSLIYGDYYLLKAMNQWRALPA